MTPLATYKGFQADIEIYDTDKAYYKVKLFYVSGVSMLRFPKKELIADFLKKFDLEDV